MDLPSRLIRLAELSGGAAVQEPAGTAGADRHGGAQDK